MAEREDIIQLISKIQLFSSLDREDLETLADAFRVETYSPNAVVYRQGEAGSAMYVMADGRGLLLKAEHGTQEKKVGTVTPGVVVGTTSIFVEDERDVTFVIVRPSTLYSLTRTSFQSVCTVRNAIEKNLNFKGRDDLREIIQAKGIQFAWLHTDAGEEILFCARRHKWSFYRRVIRSGLVLGLMGGLALIASIVFSLLLVGMVFVLALLLVLAAMGWFYYLDWRNDYFVVTNQRVIHEERILPLLGQQIIRQAPLRNVQNVIVEQEGFIPTTFKFSEVRIETAGPEGTILFDMVSDAGKLREIVLRLHRRYETRSAAERRADIRREIEKRLGTHLQRQGADAVEEEAFVPPPPAPVEAPPEKRLTLGAVLGNAWRSFRAYTSLSIRIEEGDRVTYRKHWLILIRVVWQPLTVLALLALLTVTRLLDAWPPLLLPLYRITTPLGMFLAFWVFLIPNLIWLWWSFEDWRNDLYQITSEAVIDRKDTPLFFGERREVQAPLAQVQAVTSAQKGWLGRLLNFGTVSIQTAGQEGTLYWQYVYDPASVAADVNNRLHAAQEEKIERRDLEQAELLAEWLAIYHQTLHPEQAYGGAEGQLYRAVDEPPPVEPEEEAGAPETPAPESDRPPPYESL
ncbi:MAG: PH domain-containing protein [Anaerolineae bacterium]|nr:PH domain-containing protein [Anaerolineae bacterium]